MQLRDEVPLPPRKGFSGSELPWIAWREANAAADNDINIANAAARHARHRTLGSTLRGRAPASAADFSHGASECRGLDTAARTSAAANGTARRTATGTEMVRQRGSPGSTAELEPVNPNRLPGDATPQLLGLYAPRLQALQQARPPQSEVP